MSKFCLGISTIFLSFAAWQLAYGQGMNVYGNGAIRVFPSRVQFDWPAVESCARRGDVICRIAWEARQ